MTARGRRHDLTTGIVLAALVAVIAGCNLRISTNAEAKDQWQRRYTLKEGGTLQIRNTNGLIHVEPVDGDAVDISADRIVEAPTDQGAKDGLASFEIQEIVSPDRISIDSTRRGSGLITLQRRVDFHIRMPRSANLSVETTNGNVELTGPHLSGTFKATATNGHIRAEGLENSATVETTNGTIDLSVSKLGDDGLSCGTTNGTIDVTLPSDTKARLSARVTNGTIAQEGLQLSASEQSRKRLDATINGGGPLIRLETTNGRIHLKGK
jgi:DUF4097 and DUF4098 domain-containing protein YvlB